MAQICNKIKILLRLADVNFDFNNIYAFNLSEENKVNLALIYSARIYPLVINHYGYEYRKSYLQMDAKEFYGRPYIIMVKGKLVRCNFRLRTDEKNLENGLVKISGEKYYKVITLNEFLNTI